MSRARAAGRTESARTRRAPRNQQARPGAQRLTVETALDPASCLVASSGPPVALLHGLAGSSRWWLPTPRALAPRFRCYALDLLRFARWSERGRVPRQRAGGYVAAGLEALSLE